MHIIGTAGHVDHGKSSLIAALTGTHPDRWLEEQTRGMTLDLGFARLAFDDGVEGGIVDVPGHERFLHNMLAGAAGMELLLLVVDANEGVMPQTLEHLAILEFLNVRRVLVVASKIDLVEPSRILQSCRAIFERLRGTIAEEAPIFPLSVVTGENLDALKLALHDELAAMPPRNSSAPAYLPIDRAFTLHGLGTVVTGTLMQGTIAAGESLVLEPGGTPAHVRSIGVFGSTRERVEAGARVALNLPGIDRSAIARGHAIVGRELTARQNLTVHFVPRKEAMPLLRRRTPVRAYFGSAEILGTLIADDAEGDGREIRAQLQLREPVVAFPGLRFVLRRPSPKTLLGGGFVEAADVAEAVHEGDPGEGAALAVLRERGLEALDVTTVAFGANLREAAAANALERLAERGDAIPVARPPAYVDAIAARELLARAGAVIEAAHRDEPWAMGVTSTALARTLGVPEALIVRVLEHFANDGRLLNREGYYAALDHEPRFTSEQRALFEQLVPGDAQPFLPVPLAAAVTAVKRSPVQGASRAFDTMLARGALVKVGDDLYRGSQVAQIRARVATHIRERGRMTAAEFRDLLGTSRKYAVPMLEWLDAHGVTIRDGDYRTLRGRSPEP